MDSVTLCEGFAPSENVSVKFNTVYVAFKKKTTFAQASRSTFPC